MVYEEKRSHYKSNSDQEEQYPRFILLQLKELPLKKLSLFIIEKKPISSIITPTLVKSLKNEIILIEVATKNKLKNSIIEI